MEAKRISPRPGHVAVAPHPHSIHLARSPLAIVRRQARRDVLIAPAGGKELVLDSLAQRIWETLGCEPLLPVLVERIRRGTGGPSREVARQVLTVLATWQEFGLIVWR